jgi:hypothetical protein
VWLSGGDNTCKNAILKVEFAHEIEQQGRGAVAAAIEAARLRLRPILMTSFAFIMGVVPLVLSSGAGAEMRHAMDLLCSPACSASPSSACSLRPCSTCCCAG